jgi:hypothetical protein
MDERSEGMLIRASLRCFTGTVLGRGFILFLQSTRSLALSAALLNSLLLFCNLQMHTSSAGTLCCSIAICSSYENSASLHSLLLSKYVVEVKAWLGSPCIALLVVV